MSNERRPFENDDEDDDEKIKPKKGLRINNAKSSIPNPVPKPQDFRDNISKVLNEEEEQKRLAFEIANRFINALKDKTLDSNKNVTVRENEKRAIMDMIDFARLINSDETQEENLGTMSIISTLLKAIFIQRNRINEAEYRVAKLETEIASMGRRLTEVENKNS
jgi:hypothetical protein